jgi:hypothetical protein
LITAQFYGGLGNQLFQVAAAVALAGRHRDRAAFDFGNWRQSSQGRSPNAYRSGIFRNLMETNRSDWRLYRDYGVTYQEIRYRPDLQLRGLFQSERYFADCRDLLIGLFAEPGQKRLDSTAIHVRRGDYLSKSSPCQVVSIDYYRQAIGLFPDTHFLVFSDDLDYCRRMFTGPRFSFAEGMSDQDDLWAMSMCQNQIIANSTFSWWAAYLNQNPDKRIIAPRSWSTRRNTTEQNDIYTQSREII